MKNNYISTFLCLCSSNLSFKLNFNILKKAYSICTLILLGLVSCKDCCSFSHSGSTNLTISLQSNLLRCSLTVNGVFIVYNRYLYIPAFSRRSKSFLGILFWQFSYQGNFSITLLCVNMVFCLRIKSI